MTGTEIATTSLSVGPQPRGLVGWDGNASGDNLLPPGGLFRRLGPSLEELEWRLFDTVDFDAALAEVRALPALRRLKLILGSHSPDDDARVLAQLPPQLDWLALDLPELNPKAMLALYDLPALRDLTVDFDHDHPEGEHTS